MGDDAHGSWHGRASNVTLARALVLPGLLCLLLVVPLVVVLALTAGAVPAVVTALVLLVVGVLLVVAGATFSRVRVAVDDAGVSVACGPRGRPSWSYARTELAGAGVEDVRPLAWGGLGWRWRPGAQAVLVRGGAALRLQPHEGRALVVSVDAPQGAVDALALPAAAPDEPDVAADGAGPAAT